MKKIVVMMLGSGMLLGCSAQYTSNGEQQYLKSRNGVGVVVPPPLSSNNLSHFYDLPVQNQNAQITIVPPVEGMA